VKPGSHISARLMKLCRAMLWGVVLATAGGCSAPPVLLNAGEEGVVVRYNPGSTTADQAAAAAQAWCGKYGRRAVAQGTGITGDVFATFSCVK